MSLHPIRLLGFSSAFALVAGLVGPAAQAEPAKPADSQDWKWVQGTVFVPTNCVNEAQQWDPYNPRVNDRELHFASAYGINVVRVYLHYFIYLKERKALLGALDDFLARAQAYRIKTEFVFFDDCWNEPSKDILRRDYVYPSPIYGVHNSRWLRSPGQDVLDHYEEHRERLKAYVQDIVNAHVSDPRVVFWETYNEPKKEPATMRLEQDAERWIRETGTRIPFTATGGEFSGDAYSSFASWHEYGGYKVLGDGHTLCTECMNRQGQTVPGVVEHFKGKVGYIMWEFGIGRDNCRFAWENDRQKPRQDEPKTPFHGIVYPDGHPWSIDDARALLGPAAFSQSPFFIATYYKDAAFSHPAKTSVVPFIDLDLWHEEGTGSPDASAGIPLDGYSIAYTGAVRAPDSGSYSFSVETNGQARVSVAGQELIDTGASGAATQGTITLVGGRTYPVSIRYRHQKGPSRLQFSWSGPSFGRCLVTPVSHPEGL